MKFPENIISPKWHVLCYQLITADPVYTRKESKTLLVTSRGITARERPERLYNYRGVDKKKQINRAGHILLMFISSF